MRTPLTDREAGSGGARATVSQAAVRHATTALGAKGGRSQARCAPQDYTRATLPAPT
jgi:hypothetical protein